VRTRVIRDSTYTWKGGNDLGLVRNNFRATVRSVRDRDALRPGARIARMTTVCGPCPATRRYQGATSCVSVVFRGLAAGRPRTVVCVTGCCATNYESRPLLRTTNNKGRTATRVPWGFLRVRALTDTLPAGRANIKGGTRWKRELKAGNGGSTRENGDVEKVVKHIAAELVTPEVAE